ncbi:hypothetical protein [Vulcanisaeta sp. JCM 16161]
MVIFRMSMMWGIRLFMGGGYGWEWVVRVRSSRVVKLAGEWLGRSRV